MRRDVGTPGRDSAIRLPDGRRHAYAEWGDPNGRPVLYFHGMPHSRCTGLSHPRRSGSPRVVAGRGRTGDPRCVAARGGGRSPRDRRRGSRLGARRRSSARVDPGWRDRPGRRVVLRRPGSSGRLLGRGARSGATGTRRHRATWVAAARRPATSRRRTRQETASRRPARRCRPGRTRSVGPGDRRCERSSPRPSPR
jgi:hypothetical protein